MNSFTRITEGNRWKRNKKITNVVVAVGVYVMNHAKIILIVARPAMSVNAVVKNVANVTIRKNAVVKNLKNRTDKII